MMGEINSGWRLLAAAVVLSGGITAPGGIARAQTPPTGLTVEAAGEDRAENCQEGQRVFEKVLDLRLNPVKAEEAEAVQQAPIQQQADAFYDRSVTTRGLGRSGDDPTDAANPSGERIVGGTPAHPGAWPAAVYLMIEGQRCGLKYASTCGGSIIDGEWILTAAHCLDSVKQDRQTGRVFGGLKFLTAAIIFEGHNQWREARKVPVAAAYIHTQYDRRDNLNDIALLKLARPVRAPRAKLVANAGRSAFLQPGSPSTVVGWGTTSEGGNSSPQLMQVTVPVVNQAACQQSYNPKVINEFNFCAGFPQGGKDSCQGDSGGPIFVANTHGEPIQAGVVSWGEGCARPNKYGVYANVGHFEQWIRQRVPNASFVAQKTPGGGSLQGISGQGDNAPPAVNGQASVDIFVLEGGAAKPANRIPVGRNIAVRVTTGVTGHLLVYNKNAQGEVRQIFPNRLSGGGGQVGQTPSRVTAGQTVSVPGPGDTFDFKLAPPHGRNEIIAVVAPEGAKVEDIVAKHMDMKPIADFEGLLSEIVNRTTRNVEVVARARRAVAVRAYEIIP